MSWVDWGRAAAEQDLLQFTETLAGLRRDHPVFRRRRFFRGHRHATGEETSDIIWLTPSGEEMTQDDWGASDPKALAVLLNGEAISEPDPHGEKITDAKFLLLFNAHSKPRTFTLPEARLAAGWEVVIDTAQPSLAVAPPALVPSLAPKTELEVSGRAVVVLRSAD